jgi:S1-C subfamily serine protease
MEIRRRHRPPESGIAHVLALVLVAILATLAIVALVNAETGTSRSRIAGTSLSQPAPAPIVVDSVARRIGPAIVAIDATLESGGRSAGTGMVLTPSGQVLTNNHVIAGAVAITVRTRDRRTLPAKVVGYDIADDVAVLQTDGASGLSTIDVGRPATLSVGQSLVVLDGNQGANASVRALARDVTAGGNGDPNGTDARRGLIELAAPMQPLDAGGPVADGPGTIVAMRTAASAGRLFHEETGADVSFALPIDRALAIVGQVNTGRSSASVHVGPSAVLGAQVSGAPNSGGGVVVVGLQRGGPAAVAGIVAQDVLASLDEVSVASPGDVEAVLNRHVPGDAVRAGWFDGKGVYHTASVQLTEGAPA